VCRCSLTYSAYNALAPYCHLCCVSLYNILPHYLINDMIFGKKLLNIKCVFGFSLQLLSEPFLILRTAERDMIKNVCLSTRYSCQVLMKLESSQRFKKKHSNVKKSSSGDRVPCVQTDTHDESNYSLFAILQTHQRMWQLELPSCAWSSQQEMAAPE